jgi:hypothetical protein
MMNFVLGFIAGIAVMYSPEIASMVKRFVLWVWSLKDRFSK